jgi:hypothetical protein
MTTTAEKDKFLRIYLEDHVAGATAGSHRASRLAEAEASSPDGPVLKTFATDVATDLEALVTLMEAMGLQPSKLKAGLASVGEKLGTLKPNGRLAERSPLSTIVEIEAMQMAVRGKRSLWETLQRAMPVHTAIDLGELIQRADDQAKVLDGLHAARAAATFPAPPTA